MLAPALYLVPLATAGLGWLAREWFLHRAPNLRFRYLRRDYFTGLNYLLNEQPDKAVDIFLKLLKADEDTVETHLALGALFRRRGEVDRSIKVHQSLVARPQLPRRYRVLALSALAQDYARAGVLDRAEQLFQDLVKMKEQLPVSLKSLLLIYQQEKNWTKAIDVAEKLRDVLPNFDMHVTLAQLYCEEACVSLGNGRVSEASRLLSKAERIDNNCVRASILLGNIARDQRRYKQAIAYYKRVSERNPKFLYQVMPSLIACYNKLSDDSGLITFLRDVLTTTSQVCVVLAVAEHLQAKSGKGDALEFITDQLKINPSLMILRYLIALYYSNTHGKIHEQLSMLLQIIDTLLEKRHTFRCASCGFSGRQHYWLCPGCQTWSSIQPLHGLEGI